MSKIIDYELGIPDYKIKSSDFLEYLKSNMNFKDKCFINDDLINKLIDKIKIETKNTCLYLPDGIKNFINKSYEEKMTFYKEESFYLAAKTVDKLLNRIDKNKITHIIAVSCTGTYSPFLQDTLSNYLNLNNTVKKLGLQYMGCHAGLKSLDVANTLANEKENNTVLVVCVELPSIHVSVPKFTDNKNNIISNIIHNVLFGDGCSAFIVSSDKKYDKGYSILKTMSYHIPNSEKYLTWEMGPSQFVMKIDKMIISSIKNEIKKAITEFKIQHHFEDNETQLIVHPGGPSILKTIIDTLNLENNALAPSFETLKTYGNMSSCTIFFVLNQYIMTNKDKLKQHLLMIAFGPGMTIEFSLLKISNDTTKLIKECIIEENTLIELKTQRSTKRRIMDRPIKYTNLYTEKDIYEVYDSFDKLYKYLFTTTSYLSNIDAYKPKNILEIGCGSGWVANKISEHLPYTNIESIHKNDISVSFCKNKYRNSNLRFCNEIDHSVSKKYDIITCSNICHRMTNDEFINFITHNYNRTKKSIILIDLENNNVYIQKIIWSVISFLFCSKLTIDDGYTSIEKSFTRKQIIKLLVENNIPEKNIRVSTIWPFGMMINVDKMRRK